LQTEHGAAFCREAVRPAIVAERLAAQTQLVKADCQVEGIVGLGGFDALCIEIRLLSFLPLLGSRVLVAQRKMQLGIVRVGL
jgi:hypothetical protein